MLRVCSQESPFGETLAIITVRASSPTKLSRKTCGSRYLEGQKPLLGCQQHLHLKPLASEEQLHLRLYKQRPFVESYEVSSMQAKVLALHVLCL